MPAVPFALVSIEDRNRIFAFGLDIDLPSEVITFRREADGRTTFGVHESAESARRRFSHVTPLELRWDPGCRCCLCATGEEPCEQDGACLVR